MSDAGSSASDTDSNTTAGQEARFEEQEEAEADSFTPTADQLVFGTGAWADSDNCDQNDQLGTGDNCSFTQPFWAPDGWFTKSSHFGWNVFDSIASARGASALGNGLGNGLGDRGATPYRDLLVGNDFGDGYRDSQEAEQTDSATVCDGSELYTIGEGDLAQFLLGQQSHGFRALCTIIATMMMGILFYSLLLDFFANGLPPTAWPPVGGALLVVVIGWVLAGLLSWGIYGAIFLLLFCVAMLTGWLSGARL